MSDSVPGALQALCGFNSDKTSGNRHYSPDESILSWGSERLSDLPWLSPYLNRVIPASLSAQACVPTSCPTRERPPSVTSSACPWL